MKNFLTHSLGYMPSYLAASDGSLHKTSKAALLTFLEKLSPPAECLKDNTTCIIDAMSIDQKQKCNQKTFFEVGELLYSRFLMESEQCQRINTIFYVYRDKSIKNVERFDKRGAAAAAAFKSILGSHNIKQCSHLSKDQGKRWSLFAFCQKSGGSWITDRNVRIGSCIWFMNKNVGC